MIVPTHTTSIDSYRAHVYQRLPHEILLDAHTRSSSLRSLGESLIGGRRHDVVTYVSFDGRQTALYLDAATHLLTQYELVFTDPVIGDSVTGVRFSGYREVDGVHASASREQFRGSNWTARTQYRELAFNAPTDAGAFAVPTGYTSVEPRQSPSPEIDEVAPGVYFQSGMGNGGRYNIMFAAFRDGIVFINAPTPVSVTEDAIARLTKQFPEKLIRSLF